jgi:deazaflavin-dependent oxidoreductase (nitroreductase family)
MAKTYRRNLGTRAINLVFRRMTQLGIGASYRYILTVAGRKTGRLHSTPVDVIEVQGDRWLVAGYGPANWVRNARAAGEVELSRGGRSERFKVEEAGAETCCAATRREFVRRAPTSRQSPIHRTKQSQRNSRRTLSFASPGRTER